jgi:hypothetical protein
MDTLANTPTRDGEADRQMIVLALAHLSVERPGWRMTCREMAVERFGAGAMFDDFLEWHVEAVTPWDSPKDF